MMQKTQLRREAYRIHLLHHIKFSTFRLATPVTILTILYVINIFRLKNNIPNPMFLDEQLCENMQDSKLSENKLSPVLQVLTLVNNGQ